MLLIGMAFPFPYQAHGPGGAGFVLTVLNWPFAALVEWMYPSFWAAEDAVAVGISLLIVIVGGATYGYVWYRVVVGRAA